MTKNPVADPGWLSFDIHGRVRMGVARSAPTAATVSIDGDGVALPAAGGVGKTSTIAKLMRCPGVGFMGDDYVPTFLLHVPVAYDADHAFDVIVEQLAAVTTPLGVPAESGS